MTGTTGCGALAGLPCKPTASALRLILGPAGPGAAGFGGLAIPSAESRAPEAADDVAGASGFCRTARARRCGGDQTSRGSAGTAARRQSAAAGDRARWHPGRRQADRLR